MLLRNRIDKYCEKQTQPQQNQTKSPNNDNKTKQTIDSPSKKPNQNKPPQNQAENPKKLSIFIIRAEHWSTPQRNPICSVSLGNCKSSCTLACFAQDCHCGLHSDVSSQDSCSINTARYFSLLLGGVRGAQHTCFGTHTLAELENGHDACNVCCPHASLGKQVCCHCFSGQNPA